MFGAKKRKAEREALRDAERRIVEAQEALDQSEQELAAREQVLGERAEFVSVLVENRVKAYEHLAAAWADWEYVQGERIAFDLCYKPHPALKTAEVVAEKSRQLAALRMEREQAVNVTRLYEYHYPWLVDFLDNEDQAQYADAPDYEEGVDDPARRHISRAEWEALAPVERHQLALDRWVQSRRADAWEAGTDYERYIGYLREQDACSVTYYGVDMGLGDMGRDVLAEKEGVIEVIQCKRWGKRMGPIREKYVHQLVGTMISLQADNPDKRVVGTLTTTTTLSDVAFAEANKLGVTVEQEVPMGHYPRIKCNLGMGGERIYHLPFDQQYDTTIIEAHKGECVVTTCAEAEALGFRRAWKWRAARV